MRVVVHGEYERGRGFAAGDLADNGLGCGQALAEPTVVAPAHQPQEAGLEELIEVFEWKGACRIMMCGCCRKILGKALCLADHILKVRGHISRGAFRQATARAAKPSM